MQLLTSGLGGLAVKSQSLSLVALLQFGGKLRQRCRTARQIVGETSCELRPSLRVGLLPLESRLPEDAIALVQEL